MTQRFGFFCTYTHCSQVEETSPNIVKSKFKCKEKGNTSVESKATRLVIFHGRSSFSLTSAILETRSQRIDSLFSLLTHGVGKRENHKFTRFFIESNSGN